MKATLKDMTVNKTLDVTFEFELPRRKGQRGKVAKATATVTLDEMELEELRSQIEDIL